MRDVACIEADLLVSEQAPFIPPAPDRDAIPPAPWRVFRVPGFLPLFGAQFASSLGDWIGLFAILAIAGRVSNSATAVGFVMVARMLPGFLVRTARRRARSTGGTARS